MLIIGKRFLLFGFPKKQKNSNYLILKDFRFLAEAHLLAQKLRNNYDYNPSRHFIDPLYELPLMMNASADSKECRLQIGEFCCSLRFKDADWAASVRNYYNGFLSEKEADLWIDFKIVPHKNWIELPSSLILEKTVNGNQFDFHSGLLRGSLDLPNSRADVEIKYGLLKNARVFDQFLYQVYYTLLKERYPNNITNDLLVHASGVVMDGKAYVFAGPSGSGKSTIAWLSSGYSILNDEIVILGKKNGYFQAASTPFGQQLENRKNITTRLKAIFLIRHGDQNYVQDLSPPTFAKFLFREVIFPIPLLSTDRRGALTEVLGFCGTVATEAPCYELYFLPNESVWKCIEENLRARA